MLLVLILPLLFKMASSAAYSLVYPLGDYTFSLDRLLASENLVNGFLGEDWTKYGKQVDSGTATPTSGISVYVSFWIKPPGNVELYQSTTTMTFRGKTICYGGIDVNTIRLGVAPSANWLNVVLKVKLGSATAASFEKFYIRQLQPSEVGGTNTAKELLEYFDITVTSNNVVQTAWQLSGASTALKNQISVVLDYYLPQSFFLGKELNAISTVFDGDFNIDAITDDAERSMYFSMVVQGRPKPMYQMPLFTHYWMSLEALQDKPYNIDAFMNKVLGNSRPGYKLNLDELLTIRNVEFNYKGFSNSYSLEFQYSASEITAGRTVSIGIVLRSTEVKDLSINSTLSNITVKMTKSVVYANGILCQVFDENSTRIIEFNLDRKTSSTDTITVVYVEGFGFLYSDADSAITDRMIYLSLADGSIGIAGSGSYTNSITDFWLFHETGSDKAMAIDITPSCTDSSSTLLNFVVQNYQILHGAFDPNQLTSYSLSQNYVPFATTELCAMSMQTGNYAFTSSSAVAPILKNIKCSRPFMQPKTGSPYYRADLAGYLTNGISNCLVPGDSGSCLVCASGYMNEFSGYNEPPATASGCFYSSSCWLPDPKAANVYIRQPYDFTPDGSSTPISICFNRLSGCQISTKPLTCDTCSPYMRPYNDPYICGCSVANCDVGRCSDFPCEKCEEGFPTIFIDRTTELYSCTHQDTCNNLNGQWTITPNVSTPRLGVWCKNCKDSKCADCLSDTENCVQCQTKYYFNTTKQCESCAAECLECEVFADNCTACLDTQVLVYNSTRQYCAPSLNVNKSYFVVSVSTIYIKFEEHLNPKITRDNFEGFMFFNVMDQVLFKAGYPPKLGLVPFKISDFKVYMSHLIFVLEIESREVVDGIFMLRLKEKMMLNNTDQTKFYHDSEIIVDNIDYYRSSSSFESLLGIFFGIVVGINGIAALFIPAIKFTTMSMKIFQLNNYFFLVNVDLPYNLYLFFKNIQFGNIIRLAVLFNPLDFLTNDNCREFQDKLLALGKTCQLFDNAGPHFIFFGLSFLIKICLEAYQKSQEKAGVKRGKLYEFLKLKFGKRYFIELLYYFHMDLVLYNLMNLLFAELGDFLSFLNLLLAVVLMIFFFYFYIILFVIIAENSKDYLLTNLCDPEGKLGLIQTENTVAVNPAEPGEAIKPSKTMALKPSKTIVAKPSNADLSMNQPLNKSEIDASDLNTSVSSKLTSKTRINQVGPKASGEQSSKSSGNKKSDSQSQRPSAIPGTTTIEGEENEPTNSKGQIASHTFSWTALTKDLKVRKYVLPGDPPKKEDKDKNGKRIVQPVLVTVQKKGPAEDATFSGANIYRFLFVASHCMNTYSRQYYAVQFVKEFLLAAVIVIAYSSGYIQTLAFTAVFFAYFILNITKNPLQNEMNNKLLRWYSFLYFFMSMMTFVLVVFAGRVSPYSLHMFGYLLMFLEMCIIGVVVTMTIFEFLKKHKDKKELEAQKAKMMKQETVLTKGDGGLDDKKTLMRDTTNKSKSIRRMSPTNSSKKSKREDMQSQLSLDSFKRIGLEMPSKQKAGEGVFFDMSKISGKKDKQANDEMDDNSEMGESVAAPKPPVKPSTKITKKQSLASKKSGNYTASVKSSGQNSAASNKKINPARKNPVEDTKKVQAKRVDSNSDQVSIDEAPPAPIAAPALSNMKPRGRR